jgi:hypothetical protein
MGLLERYLVASLVYGFTRTVFVLHNADMCVYNHVSREYETRPVLPTEMLAACLFGVAAAPWYTPVRLVWDVYALDLAAHGRYELESGHSSRRKLRTVLEIIVR